MRVYTFSVEIEIGIKDGENKEDALSELDNLLNEMSSRSWGYLKPKKVKYIKHRNIKEG